MKKYIHILAAGSKFIPTGRKILWLEKNFTPWCRQIPQTFRLAKVKISEKAETIHCVKQEQTFLAPKWRKVVGGRRKERKGNRQGLGLREEMEDWCQSPDVLLCDPLSELCSFRKVHPSLLSITESTGAWKVVWKLGVAWVLTWGR